MDKEQGRKPEGALGRNPPQRSVLQPSTDIQLRGFFDRLAASNGKALARLMLTGASGGKMKDACDLCIRAPSDRTNHIQEMHIAIGHLLCGTVEEALC
jgi:D-sedoheptulose 7-phosphate isomerase